MSRYPKEAVVFEIVSLRGHEVDVLKVGDHVEGAGACCLNTGRAWQCGVFVINGAPSELDEYHWAANLKPLTAAARAMKALIREDRR